MSRPFRSPYALVLSALTLGLAGCGTIYDDMYSPRRSRFVPDKPKPAASTLPTETTLIPAGDTTPSQPIPSTSPAAIPGVPGDPAATPAPAPAIPGLEPTPAPLPGTPDMTTPPATPGTPPPTPGEATPPNPVPGL